MNDLRDAAFAAIRDLMAKDESVVIVTVDLGAHILTEIADKWPSRVINVGIAEQNGASVAAGLALAGKRPYLYGISMLLVRRALAQITMDIGVNNVPVVILGLGAGKSFASDGPSHCGTADRAIMATVPNLRIMHPVTARQMAEAVRLAYDSQSPTYIRFDK